MPHPRLICKFAAKAREDGQLDEDFRSASHVSQVHGGHRISYCSALCS